MKVQTIRTGTVSKVTSGVLWESLTIAVKAVIAAIFERARAMRLAARWAVEKLEFVLLVDVASVATTPNAPAASAPAPAHNPAPEPPNAAPWTNTRIPNTTSILCMLQQNHEVSGTYNWNLMRIIFVVWTYQLEHGITMNYSMVILYGLQICGRSYTSMTF